MKRLRSILRREEGAAAVEMAFAFPILIVMVWMFVQFAHIFRASAGIQQALGQGARYATLCLNPNLITGCGVPTEAQVEAKMDEAVFGIGPGNFDADASVLVTSGTGAYYDLTVTYTQATDFLLFPGPNISINRSKRVWVAGT